MIQIQKIKTIKELSELTKTMDKFGNEIVFERASEGYGYNKNTRLDVLIIGEAPGYDEVRIGKPFVGRSGKLLEEWLKLLEIKNFVITNVSKSHPIDPITKKNRRPDIDEIEYWKPILYKEIELLKPKRILCLGDASYRTLTNSSESITKVIKTEQKFYYEGIPIFVYFHPSYILRNGNYDWKPDILSLNRRFNQKEGQIRL